MAVSKSGSRKAAAKKAAKTRNSSAAAKKAAKTRKPRAAAKKVVKSKRRVAVKKAAPRKVRPAVVKPAVSPAVADIDRRIAIVRNNLRDLTELAAASSGASSEELTSARIAEQEAELQTLTRQRAELVRRGA